MSTEENNGKGIYFQSPAIIEMNLKEEETLSLSNSKLTTPVKPGGLRALLFLLGHQTFEGMATASLSAGLLVYLRSVFHMQQVTAANVVIIWQGTTSFVPVIAAFICDAYLGRFKTIAFSSCSGFLGMATMTLTAAWSPHPHPDKCRQEEHCETANNIRVAVLFIGLGFLSLCTGGRRPCFIPFCIEQFDPRTEQGIKSISSFYNWYYTTMNLSILNAVTWMVYIQYFYSWSVGFGIATMCMALSIILLMVGTKRYVCVKPEGSTFPVIALVFVAAYKKRRINLPDNGVVKGIYYDPPVRNTVLSKLPLTNNFSFLNKAAVIVENDTKPDGFPSCQWNLCSVQQVEEVKCLLRICPIWVSSITIFIPVGLLQAFTTLQALQMDLRLGPECKIPASSIAAMGMITLAIWLPFYDRILVPAVRKISKLEGGITVLQRIGIGILFSIISGVVAGFIEARRRASAISDNKPAKMSVLWLAPQLGLMGLYEAFNMIGQTELYNKEFPQHMKSFSNALYSCSVSGASYLGGLVITVVHKVTRTHQHQDWLTNDPNEGRMDYFYFLLAGMGVLNLAYFLFVAHWYRNRW